MPMASARVDRDRLMKIGKATPQDMLDIQLEDRALFLERWRKLLLDELASPAAEAGLQTRLRAEFRNLIDTKWTGTPLQTRSAIVSSKNSGRCSCGAS